jgi:AcrR family transcriptional regulator
MQRKSLQWINVCSLCKFWPTVVDVPHALGRRDRKKQATRSALTTAALRLVDERGLDHVTVEDISEAADVSPRTFFNYFASKDEALTGDNFVDSTAMRDRFLATEPGVPVVEALRLAIRPDLEQMQDDQELWFLRMRVLSANPTLVPRLLARSAAAERDLTAAIAARTGLRPDDGYPMLVTAVLGAACRTATMRWSACHRTHRLADLMDEAFAMLATGLADPPEARPADPGTTRLSVPAQLTKDHR